MERRLAAIPAADVVGYSRLMERNDADAANPPAGIVRAENRQAPRLHFQIDGGSAGYVTGGIISEFQANGDELALAVVRVQPCPSS